MPPRGRIAGITVSDLIERLEQFPEDAIVKVGYDYGDYVHTEVFESIAKIDMVNVKYSEYHRADVEGETEDVEEELGEGQREIVIISAVR